MERNFATQRLDINVASRAYVEFLPDYLIPYRGARLYQEVDLTVALDATLLFSDSLAPGRVASGESFVYDVLFTRVRARDSAGGSRCSDTVRIEPARRAPGRPGLLGRHGNLATLYILTRQVDGTVLADCLYRELQGIDGVDAGASRLPRDDGAVVRVLGSSMARVQDALHRASQATRRAILDVGMP